MRSLMLLVGLLAVAAGHAAEFAWIESEAPTAKSGPSSPGAWGTKEFLSGQTGINVEVAPDKLKSDVPADGIQLGYDFTLAAAGRYELWDRIGMEAIRSPFDWRVDNGAWQTVLPEQPTIDLVELGVWTQVAWIKLADADLTAGAHRLQIRLVPTTKPENGKDVPRNILYRSDALCVYQGAFHPNGHRRPGELQASDEDQQAAAKAFAVKVPDAVGGRSETPLGGLWQVCRYDEMDVADRTGPTQTLPAADAAFWSAIRVPSNKFTSKPELSFCHRLVYRTRLDVPAALAGRSFTLRLPSVNLMASVLVNGKFVGFTRAPFAQFDCDLTPAIVPGRVNEVAVVVKDSYYAISEKKSGKSCRESFALPTSWIGDKNFIWQHFDFPIGSGYAGEAGLLEEPRLVVAGGVYASDVFAQTSVRGKKLSLAVTLHNPGAAPRTVSVDARILPEGQSRPERVVAGQTVTIPAGGDQTVTLDHPWDNPDLWWPDRPALYRAVTMLRDGNALLDTSDTVFGFREWEWNGSQFRLNGVPWQFFADTTVADGKNVDACLAYWRKSGQNMWRLWGRGFAGLSTSQFLDKMDRAGMPIRRSGIFDGQGANYLHQLANGPELFDHWLEQLTAQIREERNHPSVFIWSIENEVTFINSRNLGLASRVEPEIERVAKAVMALDPTRPAMVDGGNCLTNNSLPVNGVHYLEMAWRDYPDEAYTLDEGFRCHKENLLPGWGKNQWQLVPDRPIFMGESYYLRGSKPADYALFGGEACFTGWGPGTRRGAGLYAKMLAEGYRWQGVAAQHFWLGGDDTGGLQHNSWQPVCILCREWNWTFGAGQTISRNLRVCNDTRFDDPIQATWELRIGGKKVAGATSTERLAPGTHRDLAVSFTLPRVGQRTSGEFILTCQRGGKEVFREVKPVAVFDPAADAKPSLGAGQLAVLDPKGGAAARLKARGVPFVAVDSPAAVPASAKVVLVGQDALSPRDATDPRWVSLAAAGARVLVLEQANPLKHLALPADLTPTNFVGRIAFSEDMTHPAFVGLDQPDFFTWSGDHVVYKNAYAKPTRGAVSLVQCDEQLSYTALAECPVNDGLLMTCQLVVGQKLGTDAAAQRLFDNLINYCAKYAPIRRQTAVVVPDDTPTAKMLAESGLRYDKMTDLRAAVTDGKHQVVVFAATPANLKTLAEAKAAVQAFCGKGGWLMAMGLAPDGLADFNRLVGVDHVLRPFELERVTLPAVRDPLTSGITGRDVAMQSSETIFPWAGDKYMVDDEFAWVVDGDDIAPFCTIPGATAGDHAAAKAKAADWPRNLVNGFTSADAWKLIHYLGADNPVVTLTLPRPETITDLGIVLNTHYRKATRVNLYYDDDPAPVTLTTQPNNERQDFTLKPRRATKLKIELAAFDNPGVTTGIDNLWIKVDRSAQWRERVKPLLNVGGLVKYPMGSGGLVLNQLLIKPTEAVPDNAQKKRAITASLLRNLHATFAGGKVLAGSNLTFAPVPLGDQCNAFMTKDRGWFGGARDIAHLPVGRQSLVGAVYQITDFRTSPVPSCVMLAGPGAKGNLPKTATVKIGAKADALYLLHTFNKVQDWRRNKPDEQPPVVANYIVHYADGQIAEVPVRLGEGVDHWISANPVGLKSAALAWCAPFPGDTSADQACVYQLAWTNPRPDVAITSTELGYGPDGSRWGTPALLAVSVGTGKG